MKIIFDQKNRSTFTKKWIGRLLWFGCIWISFSYALAFLDKVQIAESLSSTVASVVIAVVLGYLCKAYFETKSEEKIKFLRDKEGIYHE